MKALQRYGVRAELIKKIHEGRPNVLDLLKSNQVQLIVNTPSGRLPRADEIQIRSAAAMLGIPCITTIAGAQASVNGMTALLKQQLSVTPLQRYHEMLRASP
jgi:carbamoyl-phosphate synthase large subunit